MNVLPATEASCINKVQYFQNIPDTSKSKTPTTPEMGIGGYLHYPECPTPHSGVHRNAIYCLMCSKIPISIKRHLEDRCMKGCSAVEIAAQVDIAKESTRVWTATQRVWEYNTLVKLLPDHVSRMAMVKYLIQNGYLILNKPCDEDMDCAREAPGTSDSVTATTSAVATSAVACTASSRKHAGNACSTRCDRIVDGMPTVHDCNLVLRSGKKRFLDIYNRMAISKIVVSPTEKTWYRYYCEAVMMLRHFQRPGAVEGMTVREWVNRKLTDGRYLIGIKNHKSGATHVATIALTLEEEAWYQGYYECIRPEFVRGECDCFFLSARGTQITSGSSDLLRLHESCGIDHGGCTSGQVRRAAETLVATSFTETQKQNVAAYMCRSDLMADTHYRRPGPSAIVATAVLLDALPGFTPERRLPTETDSPGSCMSGKEFSDFQQTFPVSRDCQPPTKKQRVEAGFPENRVHYDRWRKGQYADRQEHLLSYFTYRKPSGGKIERLISKEGWTSNCPKAQDILDMWTPALKYAIESDQNILNSCSLQKWKGLAIKSFDGQKGEGVVATTHFTEGDIVCDYHGKVITKAEGEMMMKDQGDQAGYLFFFNAGGEALCIDAQTWPCPCHDGVETFGRKINHSSKHPNIKPLCVVLRLGDEDVHTILFKATRDIKVDTELKFNYGVNRTSFRGEALHLDWLDE
ncbi:hypothetical protein KUCAC02_013383 [Chaenocephalus aceratus]|nr:hypothetical protein KUCAC02_013383 [Chaenocephalus aceratus]